MTDSKQSANSAPASARALELEKRLAAFLELNPEASVAELEENGDPYLAIQRPWNEEGLVFVLPEEDQETLIDALNALRLPERFSAIWHQDSRRFEVIWTAFALSKHAQEVDGRSFIINFEGVDYPCEFGRSSERLLTLAEHFRPTGNSQAGHRNLFSFYQYAIAREKSKSDVSGRIAEPVSFWIDNVDWDEGFLIRLAGHINFYMTYYDALSPTILIHYPIEETARTRLRYLHGEFPVTIDADIIEEDLLRLWEGAQIGDAGRRFVNCYRIIEYASHGFVESKLRSSIRRLLSAPHRRSDIAQLSQNVIGEMQAAKNQADHQRISGLLKEAVSAEILWREIDRHRDVFSSTTMFEGGFELGPLIDDKATEESFLPMGVGSFADMARQIRNHLSHGREPHTRQSILPTRTNFRRLEPWTAAVTVVAGEVINYRHVVFGT